MSFEKSVEFLKDLEGGYVCDPNDPGGETKYGISKRAYPHLDIRNLTWEQAKAIYKKDYWDKVHCDELPLGVDHIVFDICVNSGASAAGKALQKAINTNNCKDVLVVDGKIGPATIAAVNNEIVADIVTIMLAQRETFYKDLVEAKPDQAKFLHGWLNRVELTRKFIESE